MGIFGWSYPPGCSGPPDGYDESGFCEVCGSTIDDDCCCEPCKICSEYGNPDCYDPASPNYHGMVFTVDQVILMRKFEEYQEQEYEMEKEHCLGLEEFFKEEEEALRF